MTDRFTTPIRWAQAEAREYSGNQKRPLGAYLAALSTYSGVTAGLAAALRASRRPLPDRVAWSDVLLFAAATHKLARLVAKDPVTSPLRAPFTRFCGTSGEAELSEEVRGAGARKAIGELITCPFCVGQWVATGFIFGLVIAPRATRLIAATFGVLTGADLLQFAYAKAQET